VSTFALFAQMQIVYKKMGKKQKKKDERKHIFTRDMTTLPSLPTKPLYPSPLHTARSSDSLGQKGDTYIQICTYIYKYIYIYIRGHKCIYICIYVYLSYNFIPMAALHFLRPMALSFFRSSGRKTNIQKQEKPMHIGCLRIVQIFAGKSLRRTPKNSSNNSNNNRNTQSPKTRL